MDDKLCGTDDNVEQVIVEIELGNPAHSLTALP
jgi:hypothetical protein